MTNREKAICEVFTGVCFFQGEQRKHVYEYAAELMGRPVFTHEFYALADELQERAKKDFIALCQSCPPHEAENPGRLTHWDEELGCFVVPARWGSPDINLHGALNGEGLLLGLIIDELARLENYWIKTHEPCTTTAAEPEQPEPMTREKVLDAAKRCVCGDREQDYGSPEQNFQTIANLWIDYLQAKDDQMDIQPHDVAAMLGLLKIARIASGHSKADNWVDLAGYAACGGELEGLTE